MNIFKQRLLNVARALRESPNPETFDMGHEFAYCGAPACAWGHYVARTDLQSAFIATRKDREQGYARSPDGLQKCITHGSRETREHFGLTENETDELFDFTGCGKATTALEAAQYIEAFAARKWPEPATRTDTELVSALMARVTSGERIPEDA